MVTEAGKELLRNTLNTAKFHNRILEENEMWKQWELEQGLTMMVSDDVILSRLNRSKKHHQCSKHRNKSKSPSRESERVFKGSYAAGSSKSDVDRWDHSGFRELYPDEVDNEIYKSPTLRDNGKKWDHNGFLELYPEEAHKERHSRSRSKEHSKKWDHSGFLELYPEEEQRHSRSRSKERLKKHKKKKKKKRKHSEAASNSDSEIWEEFKMYKRNKLAKKSKTYDSHIKEWKKHYEKEK